MRSTLLFFLCIQFVFCACTHAQFPYSTSNKKAIKYFEEAQKAPDIERNPLTGAKNFDAGLTLLNKALERDSNFWEAHLMSAEFLEYKRQYQAAAIHYQRAIQIDPQHSVSGSTYYYLAACQMAYGDYKGAKATLSIFLSNPNAKENLINLAYKMKACADFSIESMAHPKPFEPINAGPGVNTTYPEYYPTLTVDAQQLLFTRRLPTSNDEQEDFYVSLRDTVHQEWFLAKPMPGNINTPWNEGAPTISGDGRKLIFVACTDPSGVNYGGNRQGKGSCDLFYTFKNGKSWSNPVNLPGDVNTSNWETQPSISADGKTLYFIRAIRGREGRGNSDIYVSHLQDNGKWSAAVALPNYINTDQNEESVQIHPDGKTLYFASRGHIGLGGSDLFVTRLDEKGNWSKPENLGYPINTLYDENSLLVSAEGDIAFFASDRKGGYGALDIYWFKLPQEVQPVKTYYFEGFAFDAQTKKALPAQLQLTDLESGKTIFNGNADAFDGKITLPLPLNKDYAVLVSHPGYLPFSLNFNMTLSENAQSYHLNMPLNPELSQEENILSNVFFDLNKATLRSQSVVELKQLANYLNTHPKLRIEIGGHTDSRGDAKANQVLSEQRAKAVQDFLIQEGVASTRLSYKGYGSSQPMVTDAEISKLSPAAQDKAHQRNRRTSYRILP
ncbi:MAG: hypothetical protein RLZZ301_314 [Bacteroidota bacterium]|jgi:outer membrane protein OmpA-like peptidoglycan-associated protein/tetratricopeptide (TPR) repeat protein